MLVNLHAITLLLGENEVSVRLHCVVDRILVLRLRGGFVCQVPFIEMRTPCMIEIPESLTMDVKEMFRAQVQYTPYNIFGPV